jgi:hypothetical protein
MDMEEALCYKPLVRQGERILSSRRHAKIKKYLYIYFHGNAVRYLPDEDAILVSLYTQSTIYKVHRGSKKLIWALGEHGNMPCMNQKGKLLPSPFYYQHHLFPLGGGRYATFDNGDEGSSLSSVKVIHIDETRWTARVVEEYFGPKRERGGGVIIGPGASLLGGAFEAPPEQALLLWSTATGQVVLQCNISGSFIYGAQLVFPDLGLGYNGSHVLFHMGYYSIDPVAAVLSTCSSQRECHKVDIQLPPFLQVGHYQPATGLQGTEVCIKSEDGYAPCKVF